MDEESSVTECIVVVEHPVLCMPQDLVAFTECDLRFGSRTRCRWSDPVDKFLMHTAAVVKKGNEHALG